MPTKILYQPIQPDSKPLPVGLPDEFIRQMQAAFPNRAWPMVLIKADMERLAGAAAVSDIVGNPYLKLYDLVRDFGKIAVWPDYGEEKNV